ncbi:unnamed protein product [Linum trigynum]|uniref:Uncharacterized protein n=1 Tax=Linum trigynum TaxID=586398 RepID=A0AAV2CQV7_9ROSI
MAQEGPSQRLFILRLLVLGLIAVALTVESRRGGAIRRSGRPRRRLRRGELPEIRRPFDSPEPSDLQARPRLGRGGVRVRQRRAAADPPRGAGVRGDFEIGVEIRFDQEVSASGGDSAVRSLLCCSEEQQQQQQRGVRRRFEAFAPWLRSSEGFWWSD